MRSEDDVRAVLTRFEDLPDDEVSDTQVAVTDVLAWVLHDALPDAHVTDYLPDDPDADAAPPTS